MEDKEKSTAILIGVLLIYIKIKYNMANVATAILFMQL